MNGPSPRSVAIIGAGPAGLTAAYLLSKKGFKVTVFESDPEYVGGISRTVEHRGFRFDIGGHRFFSKSRAVNDFWREILPDDFIGRPRLSRILYGGKYFSYPLKATEALLNLGVLESALCMLSYFQASISPHPNPRSFEDWGMDCKDISADWAAQRIQGLSLGKAVLHALIPRRSDIKTLIASFHYPRLGPGMLWEACARKTVEMGGEIHLGSQVVGLDKPDENSRWSLRYRDFESGEVRNFEADEIISSAPIRSIAQALSPSLSSEALEAARSLNYRDFLTVAVIMKAEREFPDNWIYIHDPAVKVGRIQNFKSWSPSMVPDPSLTCYGLEYFCFQDDPLWSSSDDELAQLAARELEQIGLARKESIVDFKVIRQAKAYPVYDQGYAERVLLVKSELSERFPTLHLVGRNGMHKYNNQDHAMMTAMLTVENIIAGKTVHDPWQVNQDAEYHEAGSSVSGERCVPGRI